MEILNLKKSYGDVNILDQISFRIYPEKINVLLGPSGCGKSTLLQIIAGLDQNFSGQIHGRDLGKISYVFQEDRLLEWKTIKKNIIFALSGRVDHKALIHYGRALALGEYWDHYPHQLSGGLRQRVNLLRAFLYPAKLMLMDEPFKSLDIKTKEEVINLFLEIQKEKKLTVLLVTHSLEEAVQLGHYIQVLSQKPTKVLHTFENPYGSLNATCSTRDKEAFLNQMKAILNQNNN